MKYSHNQMNLAIFFRHGIAWNQMQLLHKPRRICSYRRQPAYQHYAFDPKHFPGLRTSVPNYVVPTNTLHRAFRHRIRYNIRVHFRSTRCANHAEQHS
ncbi:hypothetical protein SBV1_880024 [Verrucomicrobia bacterium]|nr:hypothetical protein SBV1_880024 [Verrucomicrobiota bacterium]